MSSAAHAFKKIVSESGVRGLWKGSIPNVQRAALVNLGDLTTYDTAKQVIMHKTGLPDSHLLHCLSRYTFIVFIILHKLLRFLKCDLLFQYMCWIGSGYIRNSSRCCKNTCYESTN